MPVAVQAATVTLKVRAINKSQAAKQPVEVRADLPQLAGPDTIIDPGGLDVAYDVATKGYYVHKTIDIEPGQVRTFDVVLKDIWTIPDDVLRDLAGHTKVLGDAIQGTEQSGTAQKVAGEINATLKSVAERQKAYAIGAAKPVDHIRAYESNMQALEQTHRDMGVLENLVIAAGKDPGKIMGITRVAPPEQEPVASTDRVAVIRIKVTNPSLTEKKAPALRQDLPAEIKPNDIVDAGGLEVGFDAGKGVSYVYADAVEIPPQQSKEFEVRVRNPWASSDAYRQKIAERIETVRRLAKETDAYASVVAEAEQLAKELASLGTNKPPASLNEDYVAYARRINDQLHSLDGRVLRIEELFQPRSKPHADFGATMLNVRPPSRESTWRIIWIILAFLAVFSILFFLRWYGRSKAETLGRSSGNSEPRANSGAAPPAA